MANSALGQTGFGADAIATSNVQNSAITAAKIADDTITEAKLAAGATLQLGTEQASTSGATINFGSIPAGTKEIRVMVTGVSPNATGGGLTVQLGDAGGIEATGYTGSHGYFLAGPTTGVTALSTDFRVSGPTAAGDTYDGEFVLTRFNDSHKWMCTACISLTNATPNLLFCFGTKTLSAELTQVQLAWSNGNTFDAGSINIAYK